MLESMLALPMSAAASVLLFALLYGLSPMNGRQAAVVVALVSLARGFHFIEQAVQHFIRGVSLELEFRR
jgi:hypothetical protein